MARLIISLTTIPPRFGKIGPTLRDLLNQSRPADVIRLNLPRRYRRFPGELPSLPELPEGIAVRWADRDYAPATKVLPAIRDHVGEDVEILFCDDDQPYERDMVVRMLAARKKQPDACITGKGYDLDDRPLGRSYRPTGPRLAPRVRPRKKNLRYRLFRAATLRLIKPPRYAHDGYVDIMEGFLGALVRPAFFPPDVYDIPDVLWTVDDPWLLGHMTRLGVPMWMLARAYKHVQYYDIHFADPLIDFVHGDHNRERADTACIEYFRQTYGIWQGPLAPLDGDETGSSESARTADHFQVR